ncbi:PQQ-dependent sugar dehydrogenase [Segetibacter aerophilus]|uniref:Sorbosone dehydrogenase n=1 Tax=Segetibacter aerophilus TaxID=670293 RepID=A0A512B862_9BACT|nr:sorbosone dehydrogenase family protein [Segetibacter aerophilus]GEO08150.1 sorbosone dehydrogenase [Segetibacter aerophilus]
MINKIQTLVVLISLLVAGCNNDQAKKEENAGKEDTVATSAGQPVDLPAPFATPSKTKFSNVIGWPEGKTPIAPEGFTVTKFAEDLNNPRWIYVAPNGDILVAEASTDASAIKKVKGAISGKNKSQNLGNSGNKVLLFRDKDGDGKVEQSSIFAENLNKPFGMLIIGNSFYVANTDGLMQFPYQAGALKVSAPGKKILDLPAGGYNNHWTRNIIANKDNSKIYVSVGSGSNVGDNGMENEIRRADILEINPDGTGERIYAAGLRNPVGMGWAPGTNTLWTAVNERDGLGDGLVPDYITSVKEGGFYGWPYSYYGQHEDPRMKDNQNPELVKKAIVPDVPLGAHTASLGLAFDEKGVFPDKFKGAAFIGQHGSWNRSEFAGYKVVYVPFNNGKPSGPPQDFLTGFLTGEENKAYGRPVGIAFTQNGNMLVADDASNTIWMVSANKK